MVFVFLLLFLLAVQAYNGPRNLNMLLYSVVFFGLLVIFGCTTTPFRMYNYDNMQDIECYHKYGGQLGYCDLVNGWERV